MMTRALTVVFTIIAASSASPLGAADGDPVAIRSWPGGNVTIENHWGLRVRLSPTEPQEASDVARGEVSLGLKPLKPHVLSRSPNDDDVVWRSVDGSKNDPNSIRIASVPSGQESPTGMLVDVDGVRIVVGFSESGKLLDQKTLAEDRGIDVLVLPVLSNSAAAKLGKSPLLARAKPRLVLVPSAIEEEVFSELASQVGETDQAASIRHNTVAVSKDGGGRRRAKLIRISDQPYELAPELEELFVKMEASCGESQKVFAKLSANQLNFRPSNGTHTPRWNTEHMMGRQLLFFSQIYHAADPMIPIVDLNPKQMPPDYVAAHPDWDGKEEARQMARVSDFTRRFAYLLDGVDLDRRAPGSRWTLRGLLRQMERHYNDHTANTMKKMQLDGWPSE